MILRTGLILLLLTPALSAQETMDLQAALQYAMQNNPMAIALRLQSQVAAADVRIAGAWNNPSFISEYTRSQPNYFVGGGYVFDIAGKRGKRINVSKGEAMGVESSYRVGLLTLHHDARVAFYNLMSATQKSAEAQQSRDLATKLLDITKQRFEVGDVPQLEVLQAQVESMRRESAFQMANADKEAAALEFNRQLGRPSATAPALKGSLEDMIPGLNLQSILNEAMKNQPELQAIRIQEQTEEQRLSLAKAERIPDLDVEAGTEIHDADFQYGLRAALSLELPVFNTHGGEISRSNAELERLKAEEQAAGQKVTADVQSAFAKFQAASNQAQNYKQNILPASTQMEELSSESYQAGKTGILGVLDAQRSAREVRLEYLDILLNLQTALADLELASGTELK